MPERKKMIVAVCLNPALDKMSVVDAPPDGDVRRVKESSISAGGKAVNAARVLKSLGAAVTVTGLCGGAAGEVFERKLSEEGLSGVFSGTRGETRINVTIAESARGTETHFVDPGPVVSPAELRKFRKMFSGLIKDLNPACAVFSGSLPPGAPDDLYAELIAEAKRHGIKTALDTSGKPLKSGMEAVPDIVKPNESELDELAGRKITKIRDKMDFALQLDTPETLVSMGRRGAFLAYGGNLFRALPIDPAGRGAVGAGDALLAGYLFSRIVWKNPPEESLKTGSACARAGISGKSPGNIRISEVETFKNAAKVKRIRL